MNDFKENKYNVIISTSIGEEGLDIPRVNTVIFYEPVPSAIRKIQRTGRTARHEKGKVIVLMTKNTRDEVYFWISHNKEKRMYKLLEGLKGRLKTSGNEKLGKYSKEDLKVFVDSREKGSGIVKELIELGMNVEMKRLDVADYIISDRVGVEVKNVQDFVNSIIDKRLLVQVKSLRENFERPIVIIEGEDDIYSVRNVHPNAIRGMIASIVIDFGVPIVNTKNFNDTAAFLKVLAKREQDKAEKDFGVRLERKPLTTKEQQEFIIESLPGVGPSVAKGLLMEFKSVKRIVNADKDELRKVENIGEKKAEEIKRVVEEEYGGE